MNTIKECLEKEFDLMVTEGYDHKLHADNDFIIALVVPPHEGNKYHYLVRFSTIASFDRWANSRAIEKEFNTTTEVVEYLKNSKLDIYIRGYLNISLKNMNILKKNLNPLEDINFL